MKVIVINPYDQTITEQDSNNTFEDYYAKIGNGCDIIQPVKLNGRDKIYLDEEGLLKGNPALFTLEGASQPFAGIGIVEGSKAKGVKLTLDEVKDMVYWVANLGGMLMKVSYRDNEATKTLD